MIPPGRLKKESKKYDARGISKSSGHLSNTSPYLLISYSVEISPFFVAVLARVVYSFYP
jgi:hypothetical protein